MLNINDIGIGDVLFNNVMNSKYLVVDGNICEDSRYTTLYLRSYNKVKKSLELGTTLKVHNYNDYTIEINGGNNSYFDKDWEVVDHMDIEVIKYFRLRGIQG